MVYSKVDDQEYGRRGEFTLRRVQSRNCWISRLLAEGLAFKGSVALFDQRFHFAFGFFQLPAAFGGEARAFLEEAHGILEAEVAAFQLRDDFFQPGERFLKAGQRGSPRGAQRLRRRG